MQPLYSLYLQGFGLDYSELREYTHGFFSNVAEILGDSFTQVTRVFKVFQFLIDVYFY